jgi:Holliday junction resolvase
MQTAGGEVRDAEQIRKVIRKLANTTGEPLIDVHFSAVLDTVLDPVELERQRIRRHVFLARFARQSLLGWEDIEGRVVRKYVTVLAEFLREEGDAVKLAASRGSAEA